jgi:hypothetical protein
VGAVDFSIDVRLVEALRAALPLAVFAETGTFEGEAVARVRQLFSKIHSVELSDSYYTQAKERFAADANVELHHGDSAAVLGELRPQLEAISVLYWLDAHWCVAEDTAGGRSQCPLLSELTAIGHLNRESVVLIDDARLFLATPPHPHEATDWPHFQSVLDRLRLLSSEHELTVMNDVLIYSPAVAREALSSYARSYGVDWLAKLHRLEQLEMVDSQRLEAIAELARERDLQATAARERLAVIDELSRRLDVEQTPPTY